MLCLPDTSRRAADRHWQHGCGLAGQRQWAAAAKAFARATRAAPTDALYWINLANAERNAQALERAEAAARQALCLQPGNPLALKVLGQSLATMHRYAESVEVFAQLEASGTLEPEVLVQQASMLQALQRHRQAMHVLLRALTARPHLLRGQQFMPG